VREGLGEKRMDHVDLTILVVIHLWVIRRILVLMVGLLLVRGIEGLLIVFVMGGLIIQL
jgi:hypothetical protein